MDPRSETPQPRPVSRRAMLRTTLIGMGLLVGCGPTTPASPPPAAQPTAAKPAASGASSGAPAAAPTTAPARAAAPRTVEEIATYSGPDRQQMLEEGARREGKLLWYTSLIVDQAVRPMTAAFQARYPFITVDHYRANSGDIVQRVTTEYQASRHDVGVVDGTSSVPALKAAGLLTPFKSPETAAYPAEMYDPQGSWVALKVAYSTLGYNTQMVSAAEVPKTYEELLDPKWKGKMGWSTSAGSGGPDFVGNLLLTRGREATVDYLRRLAQQDVRSYNLSVRAVLDQVIAGEVPLGVHISNHHAYISRNKGAPVDFVPLEPVPVALQSLALPVRSASPHAAMLFIDYVLSETGQKVLRDNEYIPSRPNVEGVDPRIRLSETRYKLNVLKPEESFAQEREWVRVFNEFFKG